MMLRNCVIYEHNISVERNEKNSIAFHNLSQKTGDRVN
jgi:hypothetical protein